ncbi:MAG: hypothetical protein E7374_01400 [Clostridiales bacterium]|nr:hypothetical protein [Clostridiales bacterium]
MDILNRDFYIVIIEKYFKKSKYKSNVVNIDKITEYCIKQSKEGSSSFYKIREIVEFTLKVLMKHKYLSQIDENNYCIIESLFDVDFIELMVHKKNNYSKFFKDNAGIESRTTYNQDII